MPFLCSSVLGITHNLDHVSATYCTLFHSFILANEKMQWTSRSGLNKPHSPPRPRREKRKKKAKRMEKYPILHIYIHFVILLLKCTSTWWVMTSLHCVIKSVFVQSWPWNGSFFHNTKIKYKCYYNKRPVSKNSKSCFIHCVT